MDCNHDSNLLDALLCIIVYSCNHNTENLKMQVYLCGKGLYMSVWARILVQVTINRRLLIGRDGHLDQSEDYDLL